MPTWLWVLAEVLAFFAGCAVGQHALAEFAKTGRKRVYEMLADMEAQQTHREAGVLFAKLTGYTKALEDAGLMPPARAHEVSGAGAGHSTGVRSGHRPPNVAADAGCRN